MSGTNGIRVAARLRIWVLCGAVALSVAGMARADDPAADDNLNATLWTQRSVEFKGNALTAFSLATLRLDQALADKDWAAATEQTGNYQDLPPAVILDVDETLLDNSAYQAWMVKNDESFHPKTWGPFVKTESSTEIPGALAFTRYADAHGVKVFYVSNRDASLEEATRANLKRLGFPMGGNVDTVLLKKEKKEWGSRKGNRRSHVAKDYRILLLVGDNYGDFVDGYKQTQAERLALMQKHQDRWGSSWIVVSNPTYGSWESSPYGFNYKLSGAEKRKMKLDSLTAWEPK